MKNTLAVLSTVALVVTVVEFRNAPSQLVWNSILWNFVSIFAIELLAFGFWAAVVYPKLFSPLRRIPTIKGGNFFMGHFTTILKSPTGDPHRHWIDEAPDANLLRYEHAFNTSRVMPVSAKALSEVLVQKSYDFIKPPHLVAALSRLLGVGILVAEGDEHKTQRKHLMPAFSFRHVKDLYPIFWDKSRDLVNAMGVAAEAEVANEDGEKLVLFRTWASRATLDIIGLAGFGKDFDSLHDPDNELSRVYREIFQPNRVVRFMQLLGNVVPIRLIRLIPNKRNKTLKDAVHTIRKTADDLIQSKKQKMEKGGRTDVDIISVALESGAFTDDQLINQLMTFLAAGHETTASALTWAVYHLCKHKDVQQRLRAEVRELLPSPDDTSTLVTSAMIDRLPYLNAVCQEILRLTPAVPITIRVSARDTTIEGYLVPKDTIVVVCPWAINSNKEMWGEDAREFNPERWMGPGKANSGGSTSNFSFLTFLHGPRSCIGQSFAKGELACLLAAVVGRFEFDLPKAGYDLTWGGGLTAKPQKMNVTMTPVEGW